MFSAIVCVDNNNAIGYDGKLLLKIPEDMKRFKEITMNHKVIMGRKTYQSIGHPLSGRRNIILTKNIDSQSLSSEYTNLEYCDDIESLIDTYNKSEEEVFIIGGSSVYKAFMPYITKIYLTKINASFNPVDSYFPDNYMFYPWNIAHAKLDNIYTDVETKDFFKYNFYTYKKYDNKNEYISAKHNLSSDDINILLHLISNKQIRKLTKSKEYHASDEYKKLEQLKIKVRELGD